MRARVAQASLSKALNTTSKSISNSRNMVYDGGILMSAEDGHLTLESTGPVRSIRYVVDAMVEGGGSTVVPGELCSDIVKGMPDDVVTIYDDGGKTAIECSNTVARLHALNPLAFPSFPVVNPSEMVEIPIDTISEMVEKTKRSMSKDYDRPLLRGLYIHSDGDMLVMESTDGNRASICKRKAGGVRFDAVIDGYMLTEAASFMRDTMRIGVTKNQAILASGPMTYVCRRLEGRFPNWGMLLPSAFTTSVTFARSDVMAALGRLKVIAVDNGLLRFDIGDDLTLSVTSPMSGEMVERVSAEIDGKPLAVGVYYKYVSDITTSATERITMLADNSCNVVVFEADGTRYIVGRRLLT